MFCLLLIFFQLLLDLGYKGLHTNAGGLLDDYSAIDFIREKEGKTFSEQVVGYHVVLLLTQGLFAFSQDVVAFEPLLQFPDARPGDSEVRLDSKELHCRNPDGVKLQVLQDALQILVQGRELELIFLMYFLSIHADKTSGVIKEPWGDF